MFATSQGTADQARERRRAARRREVLEIRAQQARLCRRLTVISREADDDGDWQDAGCSSGAQWLAQITSSDYRTAARITATAEALRELPALDEALSTGALTFDQVAAATPHATAESDAEIARIAVGKAPTEISRAVRMIVPPAVADDAALYKRRGLSMSWGEGHRELVLHGRLPLEQGVVFEQVVWDLAKAQRAADKKNGSVLEWQQYTADALVGLAQSGGSGAEGEVRRSPTTLIVHVSPDEPPVLEGAGPISPESAERLACDARRLTIKPQGHDLVHSRVTRCASYPQMRALYKRAGGRCQYPGCTTTRELEAHHLTPVEYGGKTELVNLILLCPRHHKRLHDHHIHTSGTGDHPTFEDEAGRAITTNQPHAPPR